jgi:hypothetical protein
MVILIGGLLMKIETYGDEKIVETLILTDNDHVQYDIMYLLKMSGILYIIRCLII